MLSFLFFRLVRLILWRMGFGREIVIIGKPKAVLKIVKSACSGSVTNGKAGKDGMERVFFEVSSPFCIGSDFKLHRGRMERSMSEGSLGAGPKSE